MDSKPTLGASYILYAVNLYFLLQAKIPARNHHHSIISFFVQLGSLEVECECPGSDFAQEFLLEAEQHSSLSTPKPPT